MQCYELCVFGVLEVKTEHYIYYNHLMHFKSLLMMDLQTGAQNKNETYVHVYEYIFIREKIHPAKNTTIRYVHVLW